MRSLCTATKSSPRLPQLEKARMQHAATKTQRRSINQSINQVEKDFYSTRQDYAHSHQEVVTEERDLCPNSQEVS